jgi:putative ABC transport system substrate-binding protein
MPFQPIGRRRLAFGLSALGEMARCGWPASAQPAHQLSVIGWLSPRSPNTELDIDSFLRGLAQAGFVDGRNVRIEYRWADGDYDRLPSLAADLVQARPAVIVTTGGPRTAWAARSATPTIPIVFVSGSDPVRAGLVQSFRRPGGATTGVHVPNTVFGPKRLELLRDILPSAREIAYFVNPSSDIAAMQIAELSGVMPDGAGKLTVFNAGTPDEIDIAFDQMARQRMHALLMSADPFFQVMREQIVALTIRHSLPTIFEWPSFVRAGGLASYSASLEDTWSQLGDYAGRILSGAHPGDLPVVQSTRTVLAINLKTARALGISFPPVVLARADEVVE